MIQKIYILTTKVRSDRLEMLIPELEKSDIFKIFRDRMCLRVSSHTS